MVKVLCINSSDRPNDIPLSKWIAKGDYYHVNFITRVLPQNILSFGLYEKPLGVECYPYQYFISTRFAVRPEDVQELIDMYKDLGEVLSDDVISELLDKSNISLTLKL